MNGNREFGRKLAELRKACKLNQTEVAQKISLECATLFNRDPITNRAVSKWETGEATPDAERIIALAKVLGVTTDALLLGREEPAPAHPGEAARQALHRH